MNRASMHVSDVCFLPIIRNLYVSVLPPGLGQHLDPHVHRVIVVLIVVDFLVIENERRGARLLRQVFHLQFRRIDGLPSDSKPGA